MKFAKLQLPTKLEEFWRLRSKLKSRIIQDEVSRKQVFRILAMNLHWILVVWGDEYTEYFLKVVLPTHLAPLNIPNCCKQFRSYYKIYTTSRDANKIRESTIFYSLMSALNGQVEFIVDVLDVDDNAKISGLSQRPGEYISGSRQHQCHLESHVRNYNAMNRCHQHAIMVGQRIPDVGFVFLPADTIFSDGSFTHMLRIATEGKRAIMICGIRVAKDSFEPALLNKYQCNSSLAISISSRELAKLGKSHLHPIDRSFFWDCGDFSELPTHIYWMRPKKVS